jgi:CPA2 family monovalent cation:H+ antiporter-2
VIARCFGYAGRTSLAVGLGLAQIGEFSFVLGRMGSELGILTAHQFSLILGTALASIVATPALFRAYLPVYAALRRAFPRWTSGRLPRRAPAATGALTALVDHVVICGFGRVGRNLGEVLARHGAPMAVIDIDHNALQEAAKRGIPTVYGDAANLEVMRQVGLPLAKLLVIAMPDPLGTRMALHHARRINPRLLVLCRAHRSQDIEALYDGGADQVIQPEFEASVEAIRYTLTALGYTHRQIDLYTAEIRQDHYRQFLDDFKPQEAAAIWAALGQQDIEWLVVGPRLEVVGLSLAEAAIRNRTGAAILAIRRDGTTVANPESDTVLEAGDTLLAMGQPEQIRQLGDLVR